MFRLADFLLDEGASKAQPIAARIARVFSRNLFLKVVHEVEEVVSEMGRETIEEIDAMYKWNELFPDATMAQMATAAILFQGAGKDGSVSIQDVIQFVEDCFLERRIDIQTENELVTTLNSLNSIGVLQGDLKTEGCKLCEDFDVLRVLISNMYLTELFDLHPTPLNLSYKDLLVLTYYILDPQRKSIHYQKAERFLLQRFFSTSSKSPTNWDGQLFRNVAEQAKHAAVLDGVLQDAPRSYCILSEAMFEALDTHFKKGFGRS